MIPELRREFNKRWTPELYSELLGRLDDSAGTHVEFRCSETPVFLPFQLLSKMVRYGRELYTQLAENAEYLTAARGAIPREYRVPNETREALFLQADFGIVANQDGSLEPKLVEIQAFPTIYAFQIAMAQDYERTYQLKRLDSRLDTFLSGLDQPSYQAILERAVLGGHDPAEVVLLEIDPYTQKTLPDFLVTRSWLGIQIADIRELQKRGRKLYLHGVEVKRIYNRVIVDELVRKSITPEFALGADVDVEWAGHPNWFFLISKFSLPWLRHVCVPETWFLSELTALPSDLDQYVLKPLFSFAGVGVKIGPSVEEIEAIPAAERSHYILQRKMDFVANIETPSGLTKAEVRIMYIWNGEEMKAVSSLLRTGRGKMMGVDFNKNLDWVGATAGFFLRE